jgi:2-dehydropantoate 2-reductase
MKILIVGAGGIGGYFGGRLLEAGRDVTFLVRERRRAQLERTGLVLRSGFGDFTRMGPPLVTAEAPGGPYDLVLLGCKAYDLESALDAFAPAVGPDTAILPVLNGLAHLDRLDAKFGPGKTLGGLVLISASLDPEGRILHHNTIHGLVFGERDGARSPRAEAIAAAFAGARFDPRLSETVMLELWEKWIFIAGLAGLTCLMRAPVGDVVAAGGLDLAEALVDECAAVTAAHGYPAREPVLAKYRSFITEPGSPLVASMFRDVERGGPIEADHVFGDLVRRGEAAGVATPLLKVVLAHLKSYEARRAREK